MRMFRWTTDFRHDIESSLTPVWISLPHLPIHFFSKSPLYSIAQLVGKPLRIDTSTAELNRPSLARVCVEVDLKSKLPNRVWIGCGEWGFWQEVCYEHLPKYCIYCSKKGHGITYCLFKSPPKTTDRSFKKPEPTELDQGTKKFAETPATQINTGGIQIDTRKHVQLNQLAINAQEGRKYAHMSISNRGKREGPKVMVGKCLEDPFGLFLVHLHYHQPLPNLY